MSQLETAANPQTLRRIAIDPVTRVEGHGKVTILLDENNKVHQVRLHIVEFRGFETFIEGRPFWEVSVMVQRLCGICPVSHHLASAKAMDIIVGAPVLTPSAEKLRRLLHYGQTLQSHAVHFFHLASPDLLLGFDSDHTRRNIVAVAAGFPEIAKQGVLLRKYGQEVIRIVSGKRVHGAVAIPGGMNKPLASEDRDLLRRDIDRMISWSRDAVQLLKKLYETEAAFYSGFGAVDSNMLALVGANGAMDLYHGKLRARDADGGLVFDHADYAGYQDLIQEEVKPWSYMKFPHIKSLGRDDGWYKVGPLARVQTCDFIPTALAEAERQNLLAVANGRPAHGALYYHWARLIELLHAAEVIRELLDDPDIVGTDLMAEHGQRVSEAVGVIEAPRGTLFHHYRVDDNDLVSFCNLIVSTTSNNQAMNEAVRHVAKEHLCGREVTEGLLNHIEVAIRAYDPCLSCATHALGKMPLEVELLDADGSRVDCRRRNFAG
jgi:NAD-reducing hydrogenase large subunit